MITPRLLILTLIAGSLLGTEYYVDPNGDDNHAGTELAPFKTIGKAASVATSPGDVVLVQPGTYDNFSYSSNWNHIYLSSSGAVNNPITFRGIRDAQGNRPVVVSPSISAFSINNASNLVIEGFEIIPAAGDPKDIDGTLGGWGYSRYDRRAVNTASSNGYICTNLIIRDNYIHDFGDNGIGLGGADYVIIEDNLVEHCAYLTNNGNSGISAGFFRPSSISPMDGMDGYGLIIRRNISRFSTNLRGFKGYNDQMTDGHGIILDYYSRDPQSKDRVYFRPALLENNIVHGNGARGINVFWADDVDLVNNTAFDNLQTTRIANPAYTLAFAADGEIGLQNSTGVRMLNNVMYARGSQATLSIQNTTGVQRSGNIHWNTNGAVPGTLAAGDSAVDPGFVAPNGLSQTEANTLATMTNPFNASSTSASLWEPSTTFTMPDLRLQRNGGAVDAGLSSGLGLTAPSDDQTTASRPWGSATDVGALEYHPSTLRSIMVTVRDDNGGISVEMTINPGTTITANDGDHLFEDLDAGVDHQVVFTGLPDGNV